MRRQGKTYGEICKLVDRKIPRSTLTYWCKGIILNKAKQSRIVALRRMNLEGARAKALIAHKQKRKHYLQLIESRNEHLARLLTDKNVSKLLLAMLYLGEGAKWKSHRGLQLGSSNPEIITLYINLLERCYSVSRKQLKAVVYYRIDQNLQSLITFWSQRTGVPKSNFYKSKPDARTKGKKTRRGYYGVCAIFGPGTEIQLELETIANMFFEKKRD